MKFAEHFKAARSVGTPIILVRTSDPASTIRTLSVAAAEFAASIKDEKGKPEPEPAVLTHDVCRGLKAFNEHGKAEHSRLLGNAQQETTFAPLNVLKLIEKAGNDVLIFFANGHRFWNDTPIMQALWNLRDVFKKTGSTLVIMATFGATLPAELTQDVLILDEPLPTEEELEATVKETVKASGLKELPAETRKKAVSALIGLAAYPAEAETAMCLSKKGLNLDDLWERKRQVIEQIRGFSVYRGKETFADLGGLENSKQFFLRLAKGPERPDGIVFSDEIEKMFAGFGTDTSGTTTKSVGSLLTYMEDRRIMGSLFLGQPGSGKSAEAKALGNEMGVPTVLADWAAMETAHVGATGENQRAALAVITAMFKKPLFLSTCNSWGSLPPEFRRRYWLPVFYFDLPTPEERKLIWPIHLKANRLDLSQELPRDDNWTGAEIRNCCTQARMLDCSLIEAAGYVIPIAVSAAEKVRQSRQEATGKFISAGAPGLYRLPDETGTTKTARRIRTTQVDTESDALTL